MNEGLRVAFYTQGCRLNQSETAALTQSFDANGYEICSYKSDPDITVVNTCTVTENGDKDTIKLLSQIRRIRPDTKVALIGCQSQVLRQKLMTLPNVQWVVGNQEKMGLASLISETISQDTPSFHVSKIKRVPFSLSVPAIDRRHTRANLKIQDGCDNYCSFCVIPLARGPARSRVFDNLVSEAKVLVESGHREIVLTGINIGTYENEGKTLVDVLTALQGITGLDRVRISSIEPTTIPSQVLAMMKSGSQLCHYLHVPIQSASDHVLGLMSRNYQVSDFVSFFQQAATEVPDVCIGTDVIVGFPGETKADFDLTVANLMTLPIHYAHVFSYSERQYVRSRKYPDQVAPEVIKERSRILRGISQQKKQAFMARFEGACVPVLFEQFKKGEWHGLTQHYIRVRVKSEHDLENQIIPVTLNQVDGQSMKGQV
ncbi:MAG: tRNA (N(6)-L-threonylcarbamoyladenosine(37)-C(2))-methylthiotransferase MtaB [Actinobacteria bacterium]|nr:tRNA (N(6)-L-threonylcarbamoyladenosine(37)-C(2))-methylthiotransferase MtaB [Actinomycetota bacterium]